MILLDMRAIMDSCFNWATSFQTWIGNWYVLYAGDYAEFQLGHVFSDMDRVMTARYLVDTVYERFNWATSFQTWIEAMQLVSTHRYR